MDINVTLFTHKDRKCTNDVMAIDGIHHSNAFPCITCESHERVMSSHPVTTNLDLHLDLTKIYLNLCSVEPKSSEI
jgi:hypothetical protein